MIKEINIDNEEEILKKCDFDYYYDSEVCSRELCMFYNDLCNKEFMNTKFNNKQAKINLGRIGIILNKQYKQIAGLEAKLAEKEKEIEEINREFVQSIHDWKELVKKQDQAKTDFAIEQLEKVKKDIIALVVWELTYDDILGIINNQIKELKEGK